MMLLATNINTMIVPTVNSAIAENATENYENSMAVNFDVKGTPENAAYMRILEVEINEQDIDDNKITEFGKWVSPIALRDDIENVIEDMTGSVWDQTDGVWAEGATEAQKHAAALMVRLLNPLEEEFRKQFYLSSAHTIAIGEGLEAGTEKYRQRVNAITENFATEIVREANIKDLAKIAVLTTLELGARKRTDWSIEEWSDTLVYDGRRMQALLQPAFRINEQKQQYETDSGWEHMDDNQRENTIFVELNNILSSQELTENEKNILSVSLFNNLGPSLNAGNTQESFISAFNNWKDSWNKQAGSYMKFADVGTRDDWNAAQQLAIRLFGRERLVMPGQEHTLGTTREDLRWGREELPWKERIEFSPKTR